jgi:hypothetical protein
MRAYPGAQQDWVLPFSDGKPYGNFPSAFGGVMRRVVAQEKAAK